MNPVPGTTLYDGLNKFLTGFLLILPFIDISSASVNAINATLIFVASWIVGLLLWCVTETITFLILRNGGRSSFIDKKKLISRVYRDIISETKVYDNIEYLTITDYYKAYYRIQSKGLIGNIPVLESFSAFFKNMMIVIVWWLILIVFYKCIWLCDILSILTTASGECGCCTNCCCICLIRYITVLLLCFSIFIIGRYYTERKIIKLVLEADLLTIENKKNH